MKTQLAELIEAYASARVSGNRTLMEFAVGQLNSFIAGVEVTKIEEKQKEE
jgi:hypothetical protein